MQSIVVMHSVFWSEFDVSWNRTSAGRITAPIFKLKMHSNDYRKSSGIAVLLGCQYC
jgi:hypothetical protein